MPTPLMAAIIAEYQPSCGLRPNRDTFAEFPGLFPAPYRLTHVRLISRSPWRRLAHIGTPRSRSAHTTCHPPTSRAKGPRETSHNSPGRVVEAVTALFDAKASLVISGANNGDISWGELGDKLVWLNKKQDTINDIIDECW